MPDTDSLSLHSNNVREYEKSIRRWTKSTGKKKRRRSKEAIEWKTMKFNIQEQYNTIQHNTLNKKNVFICGNNEWKRDRKYVRAKDGESERQQEMKSNNNNEKRIKTVRFIVCRLIYRWQIACNLIHISLYNVYKICNINKHFGYNARWNLKPNLTSANRLHCCNLKWITSHCIMSIRWGSRPM